MQPRRWRAEAWSSRCRCGAPGCGSRFSDGRNFARVENADGLKAALSELPGEELTAIQYPGDARGADGRSRKYRVMDDRWLALSTAPDGGSAGCSASRRGSEIPAGHAGSAGPGAMAALADIQEALGLDYAGIDFGLSASGEVLLFEANATMTVGATRPGSSLGTTGAPRSNASRMPCAKCWCRRVLRYTDSQFETGGQECSIASFLLQWRFL